MENEPSGDGDYSLMECCASCLEAVEQFPANGGSTPFPLGEKRKDVAYTAQCQVRLSSKNGRRLKDHILLLGLWMGETQQ